MAKSLKLQFAHVALLAMSIFNPGCANAPTIKDVVEREPGTSVVFGSVKVFADGKQQKWGMKFTGWSYFYLTILPPEGSKAITYRVDKDGVFYWSLTPGRYTLLGYHWNDVDTKKTGYIGAHFNVEEGADSYIGTIEFRGDKLSLTPKLVDQFDQISGLYDEKFPDHIGSAVNKPLEPPEPLGRFNAIRGACHAFWEFECDDRFFGAVPVSPEVSTTGFPAINDLKPVFRWQGPSKASVSYDLALYEAAEYRVGDASVPSFMRGRLIAYMEGLDEPLWRPDSPLKPDSRYMWSVRFREEDVVSNWSTQSHFTFLLVYMSSGYGGWFQFMTK